MVVAFDWDAHDPQRVYAGTDHGNLFWSSDCGMSWQSIPVQLPTVAVGALVAGSA
jgi:alpha-glucosidase (family GH31 glycosyl hydrolase)